MIQNLLRPEQEAGVHVGFTGGKAWFIGSLQCTLIVKQGVLATPFHLGLSPGFIPPCI